MTPLQLEQIAKNGCVLKAEPTICFMSGEVCIYQNREDCMRYRIYNDKRMQLKTGEKNVRIN